MRISDWSSDVCSSDLTGVRIARRTECSSPSSSCGWSNRMSMPIDFAPMASMLRSEIGSASCRERVCVRVDLGGRRIIKKKKNNPKKDAQDGRLDKSTQKNHTYSPINTE